MLYSSVVKREAGKQLRWAENLCIICSWPESISLYNASLLWQSLTGQIKDCVSFISTAVLPVKVSSQEMEEEVRGCAPSVIRYTVVARGYYSLIDSEWDICQNTPRHCIWRVTFRIGTPQKSWHHFIPRLEILEVPLALVDICATHWNCMKSGATLNPFFPFVHTGLQSNEG